LRAASPATSENRCAGRVHPSHPSSRSRLRTRRPRVARPVVARPSHQLDDSAASGRPVRAPPPKASAGRRVQGMRRYVNERPCRAISSVRRSVVAIDSKASPRPRSGLRTVQHGDGPLGRAPYRSLFRNIVGGVADRFRKVRGTVPKCIEQPRGSHRVVIEGAEQPAFFHSLVSAERPGQKDFPTALPRSPVATWC